MRNDDIMILRGSEVDALLARRELDVINVVRTAYEVHAGQDSSLPQSTFLRFPQSSANRIIALPAYLGGDFSVTGIKWVSSFPGNLSKGLNRASAVVILNSLETGLPEAIIEGSLISAKRTAASAALAASVLQKGARTTSVSVVGCGLINFEVVRYLISIRPEIESLVVFDVDPARAQFFKQSCHRLSESIETIVVTSIDEALAAARVVSIATTAATPHIADFSRVAPDGIILHVSLRDLTPELILSSDNVVDDINHVCRAQTSIHLAEQLSGNRDFIRCTLGDILKGQALVQTNAERITVFSPFGLGILDIALAQYVCQLARQQNHGTIINSFLPEPWGGYHEQLPFASP